MAGLDRVRERVQGPRDRVERTGADGGATAGGFDLARVGSGERFAAASALALLLLMLFDWFRGMSAWQLKWVDLMLFGIAVLTVALAVSEAMGRQQVRRDTAALLLLILGAVAAGAMLVLVLESTGGTVPLVASLLAAGGILYGGLLGLRPPAFSERSRAGRRERSAAPRGGQARTRPLEREPPRG